MGGFGIQVPGFGLDNFGDPVVIPFVLGTGNVAVSYKVSASVAQPGLTGTVSPVGATGNVTRPAISGSNTPTQNVGGGVI